MSRSGGIRTGIPVLTIGFPQRLMAGRSALLPAPWKDNYHRNDRLDTDRIGKTILYYRRCFERYWQQRSRSKGEHFVIEADEYDYMFLGLSHR